MERSIQKLPQLVLLIALSFVCSRSDGQDEGAPQAGPPVVSDQLPPRRSFAPLPINDLRGGPTRQTESAPSPSGLPGALQSPGTAPSIPEFGPDSSNTSGSFLRPVAPTRDANLNSASGSRPSPPEFPAEFQSASPHLRSASASVLNPLGSGLGASRPVELVDDSTIVDTEVQPAAGYTPLEAALPTLPNKPNRGSGLASAELARQQLDRYSVGRASEPLPGQPIKLEDMLGSAPPDRRRNIVRQYWNAYGAWASYLDCCDQCVRLDAIGPSSDVNQMRLLDATRMRANDNRLQAEIRLQQAQAELQRLLPSAGSELLPLPADQPLVEGYETHADWYIANGQLPPQLQVVSRGLPQQQKLICQRAATAEMATSNAQAAAQGHSAMQCDLLTLLRGFELDADCRRAFLQSVLDYNQAIAEYSLGIAPTNQPPAMIASMLVAPSAPANAAGGSVLAEVPARSGDRWAGAPSQPRSIRTTPGTTGEAPAQRLAPAPIDSPAGGSFAPRATNAAAPPAGAPGFGPPPATDFAPAAGAPASRSAEPAPATGNTGPLTPAASPPREFSPPASSPPPVSSGNPSGGFSPPPPSSGPPFGSAPGASENKPAAPPPSSGTGTQFKLGG